MSHGASFPRAWTGNETGTSIKRTHQRLSVGAQGVERLFRMTGSMTAIPPHSAERERERFHARVEELDLELSIGDGPGLTDQLI